MRFLPSGFLTFLLFILLFSLSLGQAPVFTDPDTAWHIAAGDLIRELHRIPLHDPWSFTAGSDRWYNLSWLFDIGFSLLFALGHFTALYALTLAVFAGSIAFMAQHSLMRGGGRIAVFAAALLTLYIDYVGVLARPNLASIVLTIAFYHLLHRYRKTRKAGYLYALPPLMALWVNLHGGFLLAFVLLGFFFLEALAHYHRQDLRAYGATIAGCLAATLVNPYGFAIYYGAYNSVAGFFDKTYLNEWRAVEIGHYPPMTLLLVLLLCIGNMRDRRTPLVDRLLAVFLLILACSSVRHTIIVAMLLMPYISLRLTHLLEDSRFGARIKSWDQSIARDMQQDSLRLVGAALAMLAFVFVASPWPREAIFEPLGFPEEDFPDDEAAYVAQHYPTLRFLNDYNMGGYLDYLWRGKVKVFVDGRASSLYSPELLADYVAFVNARGFGGKAQSIARQYRLDGLILLNESGYADEWRWNPQWKAVYHGDVATVYLRVKSLPLRPAGLRDEPKRSALLKGHGY